ncbi:MAG: DUF1707 domain-containing protein [Propionibacteriaceae bacterium]|nr:DUF1707 domain-containing protein [Propionibacteriaceae bacterium]
MNELPLSSKYRVRADETVDDAEREELAERLALEYTDGRMTQEEYLSKLDIVYRASTLGELVPVVQFLPPKQTHQVPAIVSQGSRPPGVVGEGRNVLSHTLLAVAGVGVLGIVAIVLLVLLLL